MWPKNEKIGHSKGVTIMDISKEELQQLITNAVFEAIVQVEILKNQATIEAYEKANRTKKIEFV